MARIRTVKPELFTSETLATVAVTAERTFVGLWTQSCDEGRHRDNPAIIAGLLWPLRPEHTALDVAEDLRQLADAGLICRYTGCDGKAYLHITGWREHQKINRATPSRHPVCPVHDGGRGCGACGSPGCADRSEPAPTPSGAAAHGGFREGSSRPHQERSPSVDQASGPWLDDGGATASPGMASSVAPDVPAGRTAFPEGSLRPHGVLSEPSPPGSRIVDRGSVPSGGREAAPSAHAGMLVAEYVRDCPGKVPEQIRKRLGREAKALLGEGFSPDQLREALTRMRAKGLSPSTLPSLVNEVVNTPVAAGGLGRPRSVSTVQSYRPWSNPADADRAYWGEL